MTTTRAAGVSGYFVQPFLQRRQGTDGQGVAPLGVVEGEDGNAVSSVVVEYRQRFNFVRRGGAGLVALHGGNGDGVAGRGEKFHFVSGVLGVNVYHCADLAGFDAVIRQVVG